MLDRLWYWIGSWISPITIWEVECGLVYFSFWMGSALLWVECRFLSMSSLTDGLVVLVYALVLGLVWRGMVSLADGTYVLMFDLLELLLFGGVGVTGFQDLRTELIG